MESGEATDNDPDGPGDLWNETGGDQTCPGRCRSARADGPEADSVRDGPASGDAGRRQFVVPPTSRLRSRPDAERPRPGGAHGKCHCGYHRGGSSGPAGGHDRPGRYDYRNVRSAGFLLRENIGARVSARGSAMSSSQSARQWIAGRRFGSSTLCIPTQTFPRPHWRCWEGIRGSAWSIPLGTNSSLTCWEEPGWCSPIQAEFKRRRLRSTNQVLVLRDITERPEAVESGTAVLVGTDPEVILANLGRLREDPAAYARMAGAPSPFGDGRAAERIVARLEPDLAAPRQ